jgi:TonB family protein
MPLRRSIYPEFAWFVILATTALRVQALEPQEVFLKASPSVVTVDTLDAAGHVMGFGSGVVIAPGEIITNCHVVAQGIKFRVKKERRTSFAYLRFYDDKRDLCQLHAPQAASFTSPVRDIGAVDNLQVGQRVYAIGGPRGLELTLSDGLISGLRQTGGGGPIQLIQTTAPISRGSSGGGLFDQDGRLVGITTFLLAEGQNLNFALPAKWALELSSRLPDLVGQHKRLQAKAEPVPAVPAIDPWGGDRRVLPAPPQRNGGDEDAAIRRFQSDVVRIVGKVVSERDYPPEALESGWQGSIIVRVEMAPDGLLKAVTVARSSGYSVLDDVAVSKIREIRLPNVPDELRGQRFSVDVPFKFSLRYPEQ